MVGLGEHEQVVLKRCGDRVRWVDTPATGDGGDVLAAPMKHDDGWNGGLGGMAGTWIWYVRLIVADTIWFGSRAIVFLFRVRTGGWVWALAGRCSAGWEFGRLCS